MNWGLYFYPMDVLHDAFWETLEEQPFRKGERSAWEDEIKAMGHWVGSPQKALPREMHGVTWSLTIPSA